MKDDLPASDVEQRRRLKWPLEVLSGGPGELRTLGELGARETREWSKVWIGRRAIRASGRVEGSLEFMREAKRG